MNDVVNAAKSHNFPESASHLEQFGVATSGDPVTVELRDSKNIIEVSASQTLLDADMDTDSSCEVSNCGTCKVDVCSGSVEHRGTGLLESEKREAMSSCVSRGVGRIVVELQAVSSVGKSGTFLIDFLCEGSDFFAKRRLLLPRDSVTCFTLIC